MNLRAMHREARGVFLRWDRSTAFGRAQRGEDYDPVEESRRRAEWFAYLDRREMQLRGGSAATDTPENHSPTPENQ